MYLVDIVKIFFIIYKNIVIYYFYKNMNQKEMDKIEEKVVSDEKDLNYKV